MNNTIYDKRTIGRYPPRIKQQDNGDGTFFEDEDYSYNKTANDDLLFWFDGKSITQLNKKNLVEAFTSSSYGYGQERRSRLRHNDNDYAQAFLASEFAYRCISIVASDVDGIKHAVRNKQTKEDEPNHPLIAAITYARQKYQQNLIAQWERSLGVFGETYVQPISSDFFSQYVGLRWLNPLVTEPRIEYGAITGFDYNAGGAFKFSPNEIIFDKLDSLLDDIRGQSKIAVALDAINIDREIKRYTLDMLLKDMRLSGILTGRQGSGLSQVDLDAVVKKLKEQKDSRLVALAPALEYQQVQQSVDGSQLLLSEDARRRIAAALGVPLSIAGAWDSATFQSAPEQKKFYYESTIFPECNRLMQVFNEIVMPYFDKSGQYEFYFDVEAKAAELEDKTAKVTLLNSQLAAGAITVNEYRKKTGNEEIPDGDVFYIPSGSMIVPKAQLGAAATAQQQQQAMQQPTIAMQAAELTPAPGTPGAKSAVLMLKLGAQPDLISLQNRVKVLLPDSDVEWNEPDDFHITLVYVPVVTDEQLAMLQSTLAGVELPEMNLRIGSLRTFDTLGQYAVHFQIRRNAELLDLQEMLYDMLETLGIQTSAYSNPLQFKPHITMGYSKVRPRTVVFESKLTVAPIALVLADDEETLWSTGNEPAAPQESQLDELQAWRKKALNAGAAKAASFVCYQLSEDIQATIRAELVNDLDKPAIKAVFDLAETAVKAASDDSDTETISADTFVELVNLWDEIGLTKLVEQVEQTQVQNADTQSDNT